MNFSLAQVAALIGAEIEGDANAMVNRMAKIEEGAAGSLCFLSNDKYTPYLYTTEATAVIVNKSLELTGEVKASLLRVEDAYIAFAKLQEEVSKMLIISRVGVEKASFVAETAELGKDVYIGAFSYISPGVKIGDGVQIFPGSYIGDRAVIGKGTIIYANASIYHDVEIGKNCIIHSGAVLGADGFGFAPQADGSFKKIAQLGTVVLEDDVEVGANACIDRAAMGETIIRKGAKLDNLVQIAHNAEIGASSAVAAQAGIAGSARIGKYCLLGGQVGISGHLEIADRNHFEAQSGVNSSIKESGGVWRGSPVQPHRKQRESEVLFRKLKEMMRRIEKLEKIIVNGSEK